MTPSTKKASSVEAQEQAEPVVVVYHTAEALNMLFRLGDEEVQLVVLKMLVYEVGGWEDPKNASPQ